MLREFAPLVRALALMGITWVEARQMEIWVVGAALGFAQERAPAVESAPRLDITPELLAARAKARAEGKRLADLPQPSLRR